MRNITKILKNILITMRPQQWLKNMALFGASFLFGNLFEFEVFMLVFKGFVLFCLTSSAMYIFNDIMDKEKDSKHPLKKQRPIARGALSPAVALLVSLGLITVSFVGALRVSVYFFVMVFAYVGLQVAYSIVLRNVIILDAMTIALGFIFRVFAGALVVPVSISSWLVLTTIGLSLLMAFGKRRSERTLLAMERTADFETRASLREYPDTLLDSAISTFSAFTIFAYSLFAFQTSPTDVALRGILPSTLASPKWMMLTVPIVIYGVSRYLYVIYEKKVAESPAKALLTDYPLLASVLIWAFSVWFIIYPLGG